MPGTNDVGSQLGLGQALPPFPTKTNTRTTTTFERTISSILPSIMYSTHHTNDLTISPPRRGLGSLSLPAPDLPRPVTSPTRAKASLRRPSGPARTKRNRRYIAGLTVTFLLVLGWRASVLPGLGHQGPSDLPSASFIDESQPIKPFNLRTAQQIEREILERDHGTSAQMPMVQGTAGPIGHEHHADGPGLSLLTQDEDELIAEDDLYWDSLPGKMPGKKADGTPADRQSTSEISGTADMLADRGVFKGAKLEMELARLGIQDDAEEIRARLDELVKEKKQASLKALVHFLYDGGELPLDFGADETSSDDGDLAAGHLVGIGAVKDLQARWDTMWKKAGGRGVLDELKSLGEEEEEMFDHDWKQVSDDRLKLVVFSKSYCPYSKKAKRMLDEYDLSPQPFVVELDQRPDGPLIQSLLHTLTSRHTVPNILLDYTPLGGSDEIELLYSEGTLSTTLLRAGMLLYSSSMGRAKGRW